MAFFSVFLLPGGTAAGGPPSLPSPQSTAAPPPAPTETPQPSHPESGVDERTRLADERDAERTHIIREGLDVSRQSLAVSRKSLEVNNAMLVTMVVTTVLAGAGAWFSYRQFKFNQQAARMAQFSQDISDLNRFIIAHPQLDGIYSTSPLHSIGLSAWNNPTTPPAIELRAQMKAFVHMHLNLFERVWNDLFRNGPSLFEALIGFRDEEAQDAWHAYMYEFKSECPFMALEFADHEKVWIKGYVQFMRNLTATRR